MTSKWKYIASSVEKQEHTLLLDSTVFMGVRFGSAINVFMYLMYLFVSRSLRCSCLQSSHESFEGFNFATSFAVEVRNNFSFRHKIVCR